MFSTVEISIIIKLSSYPVFSRVERNIAGKIAFLFLKFAYVNLLINHKINEVLTMIIINYHFVLIQYNPSY